MGKLDTMSFSRICLRFSSLSSVRLVKNGRRMRAWPCEAMQTNVSHTTLWVLWLTDLQNNQNHYFLKTANSALHGSNKWLQNKFWTAPWTSLNAAMDLSFGSRVRRLTWETLRLGDWQPARAGKEWWTDMVKTHCVNVWKRQQQILKPFLKTKIILKFYVDRMTFITSRRVYVCKFPSELHIELTRK